MSNNWIRLWATFFYVGYFPGCPGSMASIAGAVIALLIGENLSAYLFVLCVISWLGFTVGGRMEDILGEKDPSCVVIDEVAGAMIAFFMLPVDVSVFLTAFFLFRAFDMFKIYPVNKFEIMPGATGIMMDDLVAGIYTNIAMQIAVRLAGVS